MFAQLTKVVRKRFHPLHRLRKRKFFVERIMPIIDLPVWCQFPGIDWKVRVRLVSHLSYIVNSRMLEPGIGSLFVAIRKTIRPAVLWDVGAHVGFYSWLMLSLDESLHVALFEPDPDHAALIAETISHAQLDNAHLIRYAVSDVAGTSAFAIDKASGATGSLATDRTFSERILGWKPACIEVNTITLDEAWLLPHLSAPDVIKVDVEMCEHLVFRGAARLLVEVQPLLIFECASSNREECLSVLRQLNYHIVNADDPNSEVETAVNYFALPARLHHKWAELLNSWRVEQYEWHKLKK
jgi:FkbM family methyltransferase